MLSHQLGNHSRAYAPRICSKVDASSLGIDVDCTTSCRWNLSGGVRCLKVIRRHKNMSVAEAAEMT